MKSGKAILVFALLIFCLACGFPSEDQVKNDFRRENPTFQLISAVVGEGHGDAGWYQIRYRKPGDNKVYEQIWLYERKENGAFKIINQEPETVVK